MGKVRKIGEARVSLVKRVVFVGSVILINS